ncbi:MAG: hypothetical protein ACHQAY_25085 [Hyphomicrobiales bacterium]
MKDLPAIEALYNELDGQLDLQRTQALAQSDVATVAKVETKQRINDQAYFLLGWGQLESVVDERCRDAIRRRMSDPDWTKRRAWDLYNPDDRRLSGLSFENRAALVLDKNAGGGSSWAKVMSYYQLRNQIAHGKLQPDRIEVPVVIKDFYVLQAALSF